LYYDNNATLNDRGIALFNATINMTNGTVFLEIDGNNYTASNLTDSVYNVSVNLTSSGTFSYYWGSWGNGTNNNYNTSEIKYYTVNSSVICEATNGTCYYVSPTGSSNWSSCSNISTPCNWSIGVNNAVAGDFVYFRGGTYEPGNGTSLLYQYPQMNPANSGTSGNPITFKGYPGETALINEAFDDAQLSGTQAVIGSYQRDYIVWDGFTLERNLDTGYGASSMVRFDSANNVSIINSDLIGRPHLDSTNGVLISVVNSANVSIYNNKLHGMSCGNSSSSCVNAGGMWIFGDGQVYVYNNDIYDNVNGIQMKVDPSYVYVYNNNIWDCGRTARLILKQRMIQTLLFIRM